MLLPLVVRNLNPATKESTVSEMRNLRLLVILLTSFFALGAGAGAHSNVVAPQANVTINQTSEEQEEHPILAGTPNQQKLVQDFLSIARAHWDQYPELRDSYTCRGIEDIKFIPVHIVLEDYGWTAYAFGDCSIRLGIEARNRKISQGFGRFPKGIGVLESCYTFVHEVGHLYGLGHTNERFDIMNAESSSYDSWLVPGCDAYVNRPMTRPELARRYFAEKSRYRAGCRVAVETRGTVVVCNARKRGSAKGAIEKWKFHMKKESRGWTLKNAKRISRKQFDKLWMWGDPTPFDPPREFDN